MHHPRKTTLLRFSNLHTPTVARHQQHFMLCYLAFQELGDDLFVMPSLDEPGNSYGGGAAATDSWSNHGLVLEPPPSSLLNMDFDAGLNMCV